MNALPLSYRELKAEELPAIWPLISQLNPEMKRTRFDALLKDMLAIGYRCAAAFRGEEMVGVCGFWILTQFWCEKHCELDNVAVKEGAQRGGIGRGLTRFVENVARAEGCKNMFLKAYVDRKNAHAFYFKEGYHVKGFAFFKEL